MTKGYVDSVEDNLKLQFSVRSPTFYHDSVQLQKQVSSLREQMVGMEERWSQENRASESLATPPEDEGNSKHEVSL